MEIGKRVIFHFYSHFEPKNPDVRRRQAVARMTWEAQIWNEIPVRDEVLPRMWKEEGHSYPYVLDVFDYACRSKAPEDVMVYTNADICVCSDCAWKIASVMQETDAFYSMRRDFNHDFDAPIPDDKIPRGSGYVGSDLYAFRVRWWTQARKDYPDMLVACELWDAVLRQTITDSNPKRIVSVPDLSYHRRHASTWENTANRYRLKGQIHNLQLGSTWLRNHGTDPAIHGVPKRINGITF